MIGVYSTIRRCTFLENMAVQEGAALFLNRAGKVEIYQNNFISNELDPIDSGYKWSDAGAIYF